MENDIKQTENEFVKKALVLAMDDEHSTISVDKINAMYNQLHAAKCYTTRLKIYSWIGGSLCARIHQVKMLDYGHSTQSS